MLIWRARRLLRTAATIIAPCSVKASGGLRSQIVIALLGALTLEGFLVAADPVNRRLISVPGLLQGLGLHQSSSDYSRASGGIAWI